VKNVYTNSLFITRFDAVKWSNGYCHYLWSLHSKSNYHPNFRHCL